DPNRFLIGDSSDRVTHASRLGKPPPPRAYGPPRRPGELTCLAFSPFFPKYFLAGCGDGSLRLYNVSSCTRRNGSSRSSWPAAISSLVWSEHRPAVFFALDVLGVVHAFDLLEDDAGPVASEGCPHASAGAMERS
ncbi:unnamed protein product, partial [Ectocarpus sp. 12 AP-2014]